MAHRLWGPVDYCTVEHDERLSSGEPKCGGLHLFIEYNYVNIILLTMYLAYSLCGQCSEIL